jgi:hypothetical protein
VTLQVALGFDSQRPIRLDRAVKNLNQQFQMNQPMTYQIKMGGRLDESWSSWFDDMVITVESGGDSRTVTVLTGTVSDQAALHGLLSRIRDLGLPLLLVQYMEDPRLSM